MVLIVCTIQLLSIIFSKELRLIRVGVYATEQEVFSVCPIVGHTINNGYVLSHFHIHVYGRSIPNSKEMESAEMSVLFLDCVEIP